MCLISKFLWLISLIIKCKSFIDNKFKFFSKLKNLYPMKKIICLWIFLGNQWKKGSLVWNSIGWNLFGVMIAKYLFDRFIIFLHILIWFFKSPTCSIVALEITKSDLNLWISSSENSSVIDLFNLNLKKSDWIFWSDIDLYVLKRFIFLIIILLDLWKLFSVVPISRTSLQF